MVVNSENFYQEIENFIVLPENVVEVTTESFRRTFMSGAADKIEGIVYIWRSEGKFPRLMGESNVLYIGQTKQTFKKRWYGDAIKLSTIEENIFKYSNIINQYGPISISIAGYEKYGVSPYEAESLLLELYFQNHCEYPPMNHS